MSLRLWNFKVGVPKKPKKNQNVQNVQKKSLNFVNHSSSDSGYDFIAYVRCVKRRATKLEIISETEKLRLFLT
jgi:hypothetical protein